MPVVRPTETGLVRACLAAIALRVADDSFFQPEPGTSATDHLASGLVPVAVLVAVGCAYPRWRPGARGAVALVLGAFGIATGIEGEGPGRKEAGGQEAGGQEADGQAAGREAVDEEVGDETKLTERLR